MKSQRHKAMEEADANHTAIELTLNGMPDDVLAIVVSLVGPSGHCLLGFSCRDMADRLFDPRLLDAVWGGLLRGANSKRYVPGPNLPEEDVGQVARREILDVPIVPLKWRIPLILLKESQMALALLREWQDKGEGAESEEVAKTVVTCGRLYRSVYRGFTIDHLEADHPYVVSANVGHRWCDQAPSMTGFNPPPRMWSPCVQVDTLAEWFLLPYDDKFISPSSIETTAIEACVVRWRLGIAYASQAVLENVLHALGIMMDVPKAILESNDEITRYEPTGQGSPWDAERYKAFSSQQSLNNRSRFDVAERFFKCQPDRFVSDVTDATHSISQSVAVSLPVKPNPVWAAQPIATVVIKRLARTAAHDHAAHTAGRLLMDRWHIRRETREDRRNAFAYFVETWHIKFWRGGWCSSGKRHNPSNRIIKSARRNLDEFEKTQSDDSVEALIDAENVNREGGDDPTVFYIYRFHRVMARWRDRRPTATDAVVLCRALDCALHYVERTGRGHVVGPQGITLNKRIALASRNLCYAMTTEDRQTKTRRRKSIASTVLAVATPRTLEALKIHRRLKRLISDLVVDNAVKSTHVEDCVFVASVFVDHSIVDPHGDLRVLIKSTCCFLRAFKALKAITSRDP